MRKILFLHGFFASGRRPMAYVLREAFDGQISVLTPDLLLYPTEALTRIRTIINQKHPDLLLGNSCGALLTATLHAAL